MKPPTSISYTDLGGDIGDKLERLFQTKELNLPGFVDIQPGNVLMPAPFKMIGQEILDLPILDDDVWLCSYPRSGSTWAQEMVWLIGHDLDYEGAKNLQQIRCPLLELTAVMKQNHEGWHNESIKSTSVDLVRNQIAKPRYVRCHLPWDLLPKQLTNEDNSVKSKVIYTARNPKDMCVSFYHYLTLVHSLKGTFEEFSELYLEGQVPCGSVFKHIQSFWARKDDPNVLFLKFEDMKRDLPAVVRRTAKFLDKQMSDEEVDKLCDYLSFNKMKNNRAVNLEPIIERTNGKDFLEKTDLRFIRKGEIGDWKNFMSDDMASKFDATIENNFKNIGLCFN